MTAQISRADGVRIAEEYARSLFAKNPDLSIDDAARHIHNNCSHALTRGHISDLRREARVAVANTLKNHAFNSPRLVKNVAMPQQSTTEERRAFMDEWCLQNPGATVNEARAAVTEKFGLGLGTAYIAGVVRAARQLHEEEQKRAQQQTALPVPSAPMMEMAARPATPAVEAPILTSEKPPEFAEIAQLMRNAGLRSMEIDGDTFRCVLEGRIH